jgi:hypothetical protein
VAYSTARVALDKLAGSSFIYPSFHHLFLRCHGSINDRCSSFYIAYRRRMTYIRRHFATSGQATAKRPWERFHTYDSCYAAALAFAISERQLRYATLLNGAGAVQQLASPCVAMCSPACAVTRRTSQSHMHVDPSRPPCYRHERTRSSRFLLPLRAKL